MNRKATSVPRRQHDLTPSIWLAFPAAHPSAGPQVWAQLAEGAQREMVERLHARTLDEADRAE